MTARENTRGKLDIRRVFPILLTIAVVMTMSFATPLEASAAPGVYTITFTATNAEAQVGGVTVTTAQTDLSGKLVFTALPDKDYLVTDVSITTTPSDAEITWDEKGNFTISNVEADTTVSITAMDSWAENYDIAWYVANPTASSYVLQDAGDLAGLAALVNGLEATYGNVPFKGVTITLSGDIDLAGHYWYPIGGVSKLSGNAPSGTNFFAGTFDARGTYDPSSTPPDGTYRTISNVVIPYIPTATVNDSGYGLFGFVDGGTLLNTKLQGYVQLFGNDVSEVGGMVGYIRNGSLHNIRNEMDVTMTNSVSSMLGGVAGAVESYIGTQATPNLVEYCTNTGTTIGRGRVGGIVGAVYCAYDGGVLIDRCYDKDNTLSTVGSGQKSYLGGIVGYCRGYVTNCYSNNLFITTGGGHYQGGIAGLLQGKNPESSMSYVYSYPTFGNSPSAQYDKIIVSTVDSSNDMSINRVQWPYDAETAIIDQPIGNGSNGWGDWDENDPGNSGPKLLTDMASATFPAAHLSPAFAQDTTSLNTNNLPVFTWETQGVPLYTGGPTPPAPTDDDPTQIFVDTTVASGGNGDYDDPFNNIEDALQLVEHLNDPDRNVIYLRNSILVGSLTEISSDVTGATIKRSELNSDYMFYIGSGESLDITDYIIDGNSAGVPTGSNAIFSVAIGSLTIGDGAKITGNNSNYQGGAIDIVKGGSVYVTGGQITGNSGITGGGIYVYEGTVSVSGGTITANSANQGGAIYAEPVATPPATPISVTGGTITNNIASSAGGGIATYADIDFTSGSPSFSGNKSVGGAGGAIYIGSGTNATISVGDYTANYASQGAGFYVDQGAKLTLSGDANVHYNGAQGPPLQCNAGGGIAVRGIFNMEGGAVYLNSAVNGGGVAVLAIDDANHGIFNLTDGEVRGNDSATTGGGVYVATFGEFNQYSESGSDGGEIRNNSSAQGAGVAVVASLTAKAQTTATYTMSAGLVVQNKTSYSGTNGGGVALIGDDDGQGATATPIFVFAGGTIGGTGTDVNTANVNGGGVYVGSNGQFNMSGGTLTGNVATAGNGAGVYIDAKGQFAMYGGTLSSNTATAGNGGGVYIAVDGTFNLNGGTITGNTASTNGSGIYVMESNTLTLSPNGSGSITFGASDAIYLPNMDGTSEGQVSFKIGADLGTGVTSTILLIIPTPIVEGIVAITNDPSYATTSAGRLTASGTTVLDVDGEYIYIASFRSI